MSRFYAVAIGNKPGIYFSKKEAINQVKNYPCGKMIGCNSLRSAQNILDQKYYFVVRKGRKTGIYYNQTDFLEQVKNYRDAEFDVFSDSRQALRYLNEQPKINAITIPKKDIVVVPVPEKNVYYAVAHGRKTGIFENIDEFLESTRGFSGCIAKKFTRKEKAIIYLNENIDKLHAPYFAVKNGRKPGIYRTYDEFNKQILNFKGALGKKFSNHLDAENFMNETFVPENNPYFAVAIGRNPGIYRDYNEFNKQMNFPNSKGKKFKSEEEAQRFLKIPTQQHTKYYAVIRGKVTGILTDGNRYRNSIDGFPNGYGKSFKTEKEALEFIQFHKQQEKSEEWLQLNRDHYNKNSISFNEDKELYANVEKQIELTIKLSKELDALVAYCDGSYHEAKPNRYGYASTFVSKGQLIEEFSKYGLKFSVHKSLTSEFVAILRSIEYGIKQGFKKIHIFYDIHLPHVNAKSKAKDLKNFFISEIHKLSEKINIQFIKIKGHNNNPFHDHSDNLAKDALRLKNSRGNTFQQIQTILGNELVL